jgi:hypothetical protein
MDIEATVTSPTNKELKLRAKWLLVWLQATGPTALGSTTILHKLLPGQAFENPPGHSKNRKLATFHPSRSYGSAIAL